MAGEVFINDERIWRDAHLTEPLSRSWNLPRYWRLPEALLRDGVNTLWLRVVGVSQQTPGLGPVHLGAAQAMQALQEDLPPTAGTRSWRCSGRCSSPTCWRPAPGRSPPH
ncbi:hypothetical protein G6F57_021052 [Rhizopus arrhizus]|nr:hypothetical protein G6F57_021052 [Rhizopus arrhizus]